MANTRYVVLLRGINVGGNNVIKMAALRESFDAMGFKDVATYIQSGNVVLSASTSDMAKLTRKIEATLTGTFGYDSKVVIVSAEELARVVIEAPPDFGKDPARYRYDVLFVKPPLTTREALTQIATKPGVDEAAAGEHAMYFRRLIARATQSHLPKIVQRPVYKSLTIRNWNTTTKLLALVTR